MKIFFKQVWVTIKTYWYIGVILIVGVLAIIFGRNKDIKKIFKLVKSERELGKKEIEIIKNSNDEKLKEIVNNIEKYKEKEEELSRLEKKELKELEEKKIEMTKELANNIKENPSKVLSRIAKEMGWDYEHL